MMMMKANSGYSTETVKNWTGTDGQRLDSDKNQILKNDFQVLT